MDNCNGLPTPTKVEEPLGTDENGSEAKRDYPNSYASVIGVLLYLASNTIPDIYLAVHQCENLHIAPGHHMQWLLRVYFVIYKIPGTRV